MPNDAEFDRVIAAANASVKEVMRLCRDGLMDWKENTDAPPGARVIHGTYPNYMVVVAEIPMEGGRIHHSGMVSGPVVAATVMPTDACKLCFETGILAIAAKTSGS